MSLLFLRPGALPRPSTIRQFLRSTTTTRFYSTPTTPTSLDATSSSSPELSTTTSPTPITTTTSPPISLNPVAKPYRVLLSPSKLLPIYQLSKRGGNLKQTKIKNIQGDVQALRGDLMRELVRKVGVKGERRGEGKKGEVKEVDMEKEVTVKSGVSGCIIVKGHRRVEIAKFLESNNVGYKQVIETL